MLDLRNFPHVLQADLANTARACHSWGVTAVERCFAFAVGA